MKDLRQDPLAEEHSCPWSHPGPTQGSPWHLAGQQDSRVAWEILAWISLGEGTPCPSGEDLAVWVAIPSLAGGGYWGLPCLTLLIPLWLQGWRWPEDGWGLPWCVEASFNFKGMWKKWRLLWDIPTFSKEKLFFFTFPRELEKYSRFLVLTHWSSCIFNVHLQCSETFLPSNFKSMRNLFFINLK